MENTAFVVLIYTLGVILGIFVLRLLRRPILLFIKFIAGSLAGSVFLILINSLPLGITLAVNPFTAIVCGALGVPGVALLMSLKAFL